jgi:hypothetical protein
MARLEVKTHDQIMVIRSQAFCCEFQDVGKNRKALFFSSLLIFIIYCNNVSCLLENLRSKLVVFTSVIWLINVTKNAKNSWKN